MKIDTVKKRSEFLKISKDNTSFYSKSTLILSAPTSEFYLKDSNADLTRFGLTVTKKIGNAVVRNKCKRRYREIFKELAPQYGVLNRDYIFLARKEILKSDFKKIRSDVKFCLKGIKRLLETNDQK
jgi:ribonuclease P protein component